MNMCVRTASAIVASGSSSRSRAESKECSFCGATADEPIAAPFDDVVEHIAGCIGRHYTDPANTLPYESAEGGYQGTTYSTDEMFDEVGLDFPNDSDDQLRTAISDYLENDLWSDMYPFTLSSGEQLQFSWEEFCRFIKHERRYFFTQSKRKRDDDELYGPREILKLIFSYAEEAGTFVTLPQGTRVFRVRYQPGGCTFTSARSLGPPPTEHAVQTNRMSPAGVVMMYAADDLDTALAETVSNAGTYAIGEFITERDAIILDLTQLPEPPSFFAEIPDTSEYDPRPRLGFLHSINRDISRPIARDDRVHVEYVPTQVITEYVRTAVTIDGRQVDGIRYQSSRRNAGTALVLFADQNNLVLEADEQRAFYSLHSDHWLRLSRASTRAVTDADIERWESQARPW